MTPEPPTSSEPKPQVQCHLRHAVALIDAAGVDQAEVLADTGLAASALEGGEQATFPFGDYFRIRSYIASRVRDETCHMSARQLLPGSTDFVMGHLPPEGTLADAMAVVARSYNLLHGGEFNTVEVSEGAAVFCIDDSSFPYTMQSVDDNVLFAMEATLLFLHGLLMLVAPYQAAKGLKSVSVRRDEVKGHAPHLDVWSVGVVYGAPRYEIAYGPEAVGTRVRFPAADQLTAEAVERQIQQIIEHGPGLDSRGDTIAGAARDLIASGLAEQSAVATALGISPATLRRRLTEEGQSFRGLRRDTLDEVAKELLSTDHGVAAVADRLGFSDVRSFNRAFKAWNGVTPKAFQQAHGCGAAAT